MGSNLIATPVDPASLPAVAGSYVLEFHLGASIALRVGRLGTVLLGPGRIRYYGSARGPGGVRARVARHLRPAQRRQHWHVDALTRRVPVARVAFTTTWIECELLRDDLDSGRWQVPVTGFGSSDCRSCPAHLLASQGSRSSGRGKKGLDPVGPCGVVVEDFKTAFTHLIVQPPFL